MEKNKIEEENEKKGKKKWLLLLLLLLLFMFVSIGVTYSVNEVFRDSVDDTIINTFKIDTPTTPVIGGSSGKWSKKEVVKIEKDAKSYNGIAYYEYCMLDSKDFSKCEWKKTETKNMVASTTGKYYVVFRGVSKKGKTGKNSNIEEVYIDNEGPTVSKLEITNLKNNKVEVYIEAKDNHSGIGSYYYKLDNGEYQKVEKTFNIENLEEKEYTITIKVEDKLGNYKEVSKVFTYKQEVTSEEKPTPTTSPEPTNTPTPGETPKPTSSPDVTPTTTPMPPEEPTPGEEEDNFIPEINLDKVPLEFTYGEKYDLPSYYKFGVSGGTVVCKVNDVEVTSTEDLRIGINLIVCEARGNNGIVTNVEKEVEVVAQEGMDEEFNGWIILNLFYPEASTNRQWRIGRVDEIRDGSDNTDWQDYTGPILIRIEDINNVYISYTIDGDKKIIPPLGVALVSINPEEMSVEENSTTQVEIVYDQDAKKKEYRLIGGTWREYTGSFRVSGNTLIEAKVTKEEEILDNSGNLLMKRTVTGTDSVYITAIQESDVEELEISIIPLSQTLINDEVTTVNIFYENDAINKLYKINNGAWQEYTGSFTVGKNTTIYATATGQRRVFLSNGTEKIKTVTGSTSKKIYDGNDYYDYSVDVYGDSPISNNKKSKIKVWTDRNLRLLEYSINGEDYIRTNITTAGTHNLLEAEVNTLITVKATYVGDDNREHITYDSFYVNEDKNSLKVNITSSTTSLSSLNKARIRISTNEIAEKVEYSINNGNYQEYEEEIEVVKNTLIKARATKTNSDGTKQVVYASRYIKEIPLEIYINSSRDSVLLGKTASITLTTNVSGSSIRYSLDGINYQDYQGRFEVGANTTIYVEAESSNPDGSREVAYATRTIGLITLTETLQGPVININTEEVTQEVEVNITTNESARKIYYSIDNGNYQEYTSPFTVTSNCVVRSYYVRERDGKTSKTSTRRINNVVGYNLPYLRIEANPDPILSSNLVNSVEVSLVGSNYDSIQYSLDGIYYRNYTGSFVVTSNTTIYGRATNINGTTVENLVINNIANPTRPDELEVEIILNPSSNTGYTPLTEVSIIYDSRATTKLYKLGNRDTWHNYTGSFEVDHNTTVYAYCTSDNGIGSTNKRIDFLDAGITDPEISSNPVNGITSNEVEISIEYDENASIKKYRIGNGNLVDYTDSFEVEENTTIYAYSEDDYGITAEAFYTITNVVPEPPTIVLDQGMYYLIKLNYPTTSSPSGREYKWKKDGEWKVYPSDGILLIKQKYKDEILNEEGNIKIKIKNENEEEVDFNGDWYLLDVSMSELMENLYMRWETTPPDDPEILLSSTNWVSNVDIGINYPDYMKKKEYKLVYEDGEVTEWLDYTEMITIDKNNTTVYARCQDQSEVWSNIVSKTITNIDSGNPGIRYINVTDKTTSTISISVDGLDNESGIKYYYYSVDGIDYIGTMTNTYTFTGLRANTQYTIYVKAEDNVGNKGEVYTITAKTNNIDSPKITINPDINKWSSKKDITITHNDANINLYYSLDYGMSWIEYTEMFELTKNTNIIAKAYDGTNTKYSTNYNIETIDNTKPIINKVTTSSRSSRIIVNVDAADKESGIKTYLYSLDGINYKESIESSYTFTNLTLNTEYTVYVKTINVAGLESEVSKVKETTKEIGEIYYDITPDNNTWSYTKTVSIEYPSEGDDTYKRQYSLDGGATWKNYTGEVLIEKENQTIIARVVDGVNIKVASSFQITKIDRTEPTISLADLPYYVYTTDKYKLPSSYSVDETKSGGSASCNVNGVVYTSLSELSGGVQTLVCTVTTGAGRSASVSKEISVIHVEVKEVDSLLEGLKDETLETGYYTFKVKDETYSTHLYVLDGNQVFSENMTFGDANDAATGTKESQMAKNMVIVKVNGDLTINEGVTVSPYYSTYGGPKGFTLYVTGKLTNNGTIDNSHGAYAKGQNVYLWHNADDTYEYVPAVGGSGGAGFTSSSINNRPGSNGTGRQTGGGGTGGGGTPYSHSGSGSAGTSYSGGTGGSVKWERSSSTTYSGFPYGGSGGISDDSSSGGGAGNPGGAGNKYNKPNYNGSNGTGGLLVIYADDFKSIGKIQSVGATGGDSYRAGGSSGGGTINIFVNNDLEINSLGVETDKLYNQVLGTTNVSGGASIGSYTKGGAGGKGTVNIGQIRDNQYYDLKTIIEQDKAAYIESITIRGDSILSILENNDLKSGYHYFVANGQNYSAHVYVLEGNQVFSENQTFGDANDVASGATEAKMAKNMVIVKVNGDLTINEGVTVGPYYTKYGGPKGFTLYVTGKLTNNGTIDNSHGAYAKGQNVYLWHNADGTYEYVPAVGGSGGAGFKASSISNRPGSNGTGRQTGGGGTGGGGTPYSYSGGGSAGTSYSGGTGGSTKNEYSSSTTYSGFSYGGSGGISDDSSGGGGAGNPGGAGKQYNGKPNYNGSNGTGGLLVIYADDFESTGKIQSIGTKGGDSYRAGGSSGGGTINIFVNNDLEINSLGVETDKLYNQVLGTTNVSGGASIGSYTKGGAGGKGTVNIGQIRDNQYYDLKTIIEQDKQALEASLNTTTFSLKRNERYVSTPEITIDSTELKNSKQVQIIYPEGYTNEYSLDLGNTWNTYTTEFTITEATTILARSKDSNGKVVSSSSYKVTKIDTTEPTITLDIPDEITVGDDYSLPTSYVVDNNKSSGSAICKIDGNEINNTSTLDLGTYEITCTVTTGVGKSSSVSKTITVKDVPVDITLDIPDRILVGENHTLPTSVTGGNGICKIGEQEINNTSSLEVGTYDILCTVTSEHGTTKNVSKQIEIYEENSVESGVTENETTNE